MRLLLPLVAVLAAVLLGTGCAGAPEKPDYSALRASRPRSVLVLPPVNNGTDVRGTYGWLTTATRPLAEMGYYVFPVAMVDQFLKENGLPGPGEMHAAPLSKYREVFGADAVLYVLLEAYGTKYQLLASNTVVSAKATLIDARTGDILWGGIGQSVYSGSGNSGGGLLGALIEAAVTQAINNGADRAHDVSRQMNQCLLRGWSYGAQCAGGSPLLLGPYHPKSEAEFAALPVSTSPVAARPFAGYAPASGAAPAAAPVEEEVARADWKALSPQARLNVYAKDGEVYSGSFASFDGEYLWLKLETGRRKSVLASQVAKLVVVKR